MLALLESLCIMREIGRIINPFKERKKEREREREREKERKKGR